MKLISELNNFFVEYFDPVIVCLDGKINDFQDGLSNISAKTATLLVIHMQRGVVVSSSSFLAEISVSSPRK